MKTAKKRWYALLGFCVLFGAILWQAYQFFAYQFSLENISYPITSEERQTIAFKTGEQNQLQEILKQTFTYIDQGTQSYVFVSHDQSYVLKFFKFRHLKSTSLFRQQSESQQRKLARLFFGYRLAYEKDRENNALIFLHLIPTNNLRQRVKLVDRFGFTHQINLDDVPFVIQKKGEPTKNVISKLLDKDDVRAAKQRFRQILDLYVEEYKKGIWDRDHNLMHNTGFVDEQPIRIDVGRLRSDDRFKQPAHFKPDLEKVGLKRIGRWLKTHYPQYHDELMADIRLKLEEIFQQHHLD